MIVVCIVITAIVIILRVVIETVTVILLAHSRVSVMLVVDGYC